MTTDYVEELIEVAGSKVHLLRGGQGKPLVFLHGVDGNLGWLACHSRLAERFTVYAPTHPGFGRSERPEWLETISDLAHFYLWFLDELGLQSVTLAGHFMGGWLAAEIAIRCSHALDHLVLVDSAGIRPTRGEIADIFLLGPEETRKIAFFDASQVPEYGALYEGEPTKEQRNLRQHNYEMAARLCWKPYMYNRSLPWLLPRLRVPTLIVWGREDRIVPLESADLYQQTIPAARVDIIDRCGHNPHLEKPDEFARVVTEFLTGGDTTWQ